MMPSIVPHPAALRHLIIVEVCELYIDIVEGLSVERQTSAAAQYRRDTDDLAGNGGRPLSQPCG